MVFLKFLIEVFRNVRKRIFNSFCRIQYIFWFTYFDWNLVFGYFVMVDNKSAMLFHKFNKADPILRNKYFDFIWLQHGVWGLIMVDYGFLTSFLKFSRKDLTRNKCYVFLGSIECWCLVINFNKFNMTTHNDGLHLSYHLNPYPGNKIYLILLNNNLTVSTKNIKYLFL